MNACTVPYAVCPQAILRLAADQGMEGKEDLLKAWMERGLNVTVEVRPLPVTVLCTIQCKCILTQTATLHTTPHTHTAPQED